MKVVIDTNVLLRSIPPKNVERWLYEAFISKKFVWVYSTEILLEYAEMIGEIYSSKTMDLVLEILLHTKNTQRFDPSYKWQLVEEDPDDNKFVDCAIGANVDFLVTDDKHIRSLRRKGRRFPPIQVVSFAEFKKILESGK
ncbi:putative toxin-antitoxin system toxin component, PIN family [Emticicia sp. C21]|uniref:putative toxin-antitoxin system toxin component, PIN family n=1 Tax=Emticicia sp. C21 TaxID=2302915 RepID=UPI000E3561DC|nr:putative toxin-antitoxin system toxin component, PIN family [Emticicia sp. C21]RFS17107.1 putative toxin-antitoxin system toxin component, PIN family [Emticicia sp. C21]